jgi:hypothetical protein
MRSSRNNPGNTKHRGDIGLFRSALLLAGFVRESEDSIFNDDSRDHTRRRLKLWSAESIFNASQEDQKVLGGYLREFFGDRIISMYFVPGMHYWHTDATKSLCIKMTA